MTTSSDTSPSAKTIRCAHCERHNPADRKFCGDCGGRLWESCIQCDATNAVDENFCGACGTNLAGALQERIDAIEKQLQLAIRLEREGRYYDATTALRKVSSSGDPRLAKYQENAIKLLEQLGERKDQRLSEAEHFEVVAQECYEQQKYDLALDALKAIAPGLRSAQVENMYAEIESRHRQVQSLYAEIRQRLKSKQTDGLLEKVAKFCELQPHHQEAAQLAKKLEKQRATALSSQANQLAVLAHKKVLAGQVREAAKAVSQIEPKFRTGKIEQVYRQVTELHWYQRQLNECPIASDILVKIAKRWQKARPDDAEVAKHMQLLTERRRNKPNDRHFRAPNWARPKVDSPAPTKLWTHIAKAQPAGETVADTLDDHPGQFFVAYGLALQGLGLGRFQHDLNPKKNTWGRFLSRKKLNSAWGLDIGSTSLKAVELAYDNKDESLEIRDAMHIPLSKPTDEGNEDERRQSLDEALKTFVERADSKKPAVALGMPGHITLPRFFSLPPIKSKKTSLDETVRFEMQHQIPVPLYDAIYDYHAWELSGAMEERHSITSVAARKDDVEDRVQPVTDAGCEVSLVQCDAFALYNAMYHEILQGMDIEGTVALLDVGGDATNIVVAENRFVWTRSVLFGTKRFSQAMVRELKLTHAQALQLLRDPTRAKWMHRLDDALSPSFRELQEEFDRSIRGYPKKTSAPIQLVLGTGGGFSQHGLLQTFVNVAANKSSR